MILFDLRAVPRSSYVVLKLICVYEDQRAQERNENDEREVQESEQRIDFKDAEDQAEWHNESPWVVKSVVLMLD